MRAVIHAITELTQIVRDLAACRSHTSAALADLAREQRTTNLLLRAQIATDPATKGRLLAEATRPMDASRRSTPGDPI